MGQWVEGPGHGHVVKSRRDWALTILPFGFFWNAVGLELICQVEFQFPDSCDMHHFGGLLHFSGAQKGVGGGRRDSSCSVGGTWFFLGPAGLSVGWAPLCGCEDVSCRKPKVMKHLSPGKEHRYEHFRTMNVDHFRLVY